jgi:hypothetical protein
MPNEFFGVKRLRLAAPSRKNDGTLPSFCRAKFARPSLIFAPIAVSFQEQILPTNLNATHIKAGLPATELHNRTAVDPIWDQRRHAQQRRYDGQPIPRDAPQTFHAKHLTASAI